MVPVELAPYPGGSPASLTRRRWWPTRAAVLALPWRPVLLSWLLARVVVLLALAVAQVAGGAQDHRTDTLLGWDAAWYDRIADRGYGALPQEALRFFPLLPLLTRLLSPLVLGSTGTALLLLSNASALAFGLLLHRLAVREGLGTRVADGAVWAAALAPAAFVQVMGYTEPLYGALVCGLLLAARSRRWAVVAGLGLLVGALRPPGVVLALVVAVEAARGLRGVPGRELAARALAVAAPALGLAAYLLWVGQRYGDWLLPFRTQVTARLRGGTVVDPLPGIADAVQGLARGSIEGSGLHVIWATLSLVLLVVVRRRLPACYTALGVLTVLLAVTARDMTSYERYAGAGVPLLLAVGIVTPGAGRRSASLVAAAVLGAYACLAFLHLYVP